MNNSKFLQLYLKIKKHKIFNLEPKQVKKIKQIAIICSILFMMLAVFAIWIWNISYAKYYDQSLGKEVYYQINEALQLVFSGEFLKVGEIKYLNIKATFWMSIASILSGISLSFAGCITQSLTKNPLADSSTLGIVHASVFMVVVAFSRSLIDYGSLFGMAVVGGIISLIILFGLVFGSRNKASYIKITLAGLAIGVFFNTITYFFRIESLEASNINFKYVLGGSENIYLTHEKPFQTLWISAILIAIGSIIAFILSHKLTLLEIGDEKAKNLGSSVITIKIFAIISTAFLIPPTILLVGNIAFVGLFAPHVIRKIFGVRDYRVVMPLSALFGSIITSLGLILYREVPYINSSIWMTFIGAPTLAYVGWRHWNRA